MLLQHISAENVAKTPSLIQGVATNNNNNSKNVSDCWWHLSLALWLLVSLLAFVIAIAIVTIFCYCYWLYYFYCYCYCSSHCLCFFSGSHCLHLLCIGNLFIAFILRIALLCLLRSNVGCIRWERPVSTSIQNSYRFRYYGMQHCDTKC